MDNDEEKEIEKEIREFHDLSPHRARAISLGALLENRLTAYLKTVMLSDAKTVNELFQPSGALGNFGTKIRIAYLFGLISNFVFRDLLIINKIRNEFAHKPEVKKFDAPPINAWIAQLNLNKAIVNLQEGSKPLKDLQSSFGETISRTFHSHMKAEFSASDRAFKQCVQIYLHQLRLYEKTWVLGRDAKRNTADKVPPSASLKKSE